MQPGRTPPWRALDGLCDSPEALFFSWLLKKLVAQTSLPHTLPAKWQLQK